MGERESGKTSKQRELCLQKSFHLANATNWKRLELYRGFKQIAFPLIYTNLLQKFPYLSYLTTLGTSHFSECNQR